mgnify:CR=1 FL=1
MRIGALATFPDPKQPGAAISGYRRISQLVQVLSPLHTIRLYVVAKSRWKPTVPGCDSVTVLVASHLPGQWLKLVAVFLRSRHDVDVWIAYNPSKVMLPLLLLHCLGIPVVIDYCDKQAVIDHWIGGFRSRIYLSFQLAVERLLLRTIRAFIVISDRLKDEVLEVNPKAQCLLYRGTFVPPNVTEPGIELSRPCQYVLYLGTLYDFNGPGVLIRALARIANTVPGLRLLIVGPGPERERLRLQALAVQENVADRVEFHSGLSDAQVFGLLRRVDIVALPYLEHPRNQFNFPTKLIEYLWAGKPVLASRVGEIPQVLKDSQHILLTPGDVEEWASAMRDLCSDEELRNCLGRESVILYQEQFSPDVARKTIDAFLTSIYARCTRSMEACSQ